MKETQRHVTRYAEDEHELRYLKGGASVVVVLLLVGLIISSLVGAPGVDWVLGLAAAVTMMGASIVMGVRQWLRDRLH